MNWLMDDGEIRATKYIPNEYKHNKKRKQESV
jgi:hypothetical protein